MKRLAICLLAACGTSDSGPTEIKSDLARDLHPAVTDSDLESLVAANTAFTADLYREVHGEPGNLFMSPHSIATALAMTYAGAAGNTATEIATTFHWSQAPATLHASFDRLDLDLASRANQAMGNTIPFRLKTANSIWGQEGKEFLPPFLDTLAVNYGAGLHVLDFKGDADGSREQINHWVEDRTNDKIKDLLPKGSVTDATRLVLTNAIYFSAAWDDPFDAGNTKDAPFHLADGSTIQTTTLHQTAEYRYGEGDGFRVVELPYDGGQLAMDVVVPADLATFEAGMTGATLEAVTKSLGAAEVELALPKFKYEAPLGLKEHLYTLGMKDAFDDAAADFSGIDGTRSLVISDVLHKGFVAIDEKGTEAAAATAVIVGDTSVPEFHQLAVDKPFVFFIRDLPTGAILFIGRVVDPR